MGQTKAARRRDAAEEVCMAVILMMGLGGLEIPLEWRRMLGEPMEKWAELAAETGTLPSANVVDANDQGTEPCGS